MKRDETFSGFNVNLSVKDEFDDDDATALILLVASSCVSYSRLLFLRATSCFAIGSDTHIQSLSLESHRLLPTPPCSTDKLARQTERWYVSLKGGVRSRSPVLPLRRLVPYLSRTTSTPAEPSAQCSTRSGDSDEPGCLPVSSTQLRHSSSSSRALARPNDRPTDRQ